MKKVFKIGCCCCCCYVVMKGNSKNKIDRDTIRKFNRSGIWLMCLTREIQYCVDNNKKKYLNYDVKIIHFPRKAILFA